MIDTSALVAALVGGHEHHEVARRHLASLTRIPAIVLAETYSILRRTFGQPASAASELVGYWSQDVTRILTTTSDAAVTVFRKAVELDLAGNVHDALIAQTCIEHGVGLVTLDARQHSVALALGAESVFLLTR